MPDGLICIHGEFDLPAPGAATKRKAGVAAMTEEKTGGARQMLTMEQVLQKVPVGKSTLRRMIKNREFPGPHFISPRKMVWYDDEIEEWQGALPNTKRAAKRK